MKNALTSKFSAAIEEYLKYRLTMGLSVQTHSLYLRHFDRFCSENNPDADVLTQELVIGWINDASAKGERGMDSRCNTIREFGKYLASTYKQGYILPSGYASSKRNFTPYILTEAELSAFFLAADNLERWHCCDRFTPMIAPVLFRLMYTCGLRPTEARQLKSTDVNTKNGEILISKNKTHKERIVVMSEDMAILCKEYEAQRNDFFVRSDYYFPQVDGEAYSERQLEVLCQRCWRSANTGIPASQLPRLRPYDFRHRFASARLQKWLDEGRDLYTMLPYLRTYMGHEHIEDTAYYIHILPERFLQSPGIDWNHMDALVPEVAVWEN
jgi:integrase